MPSTVIAHFEYDTETLTLTVKFVSGLVYQYFDVPGKIIAEMKLSRSKGIFLNKFIKGHFAYQKLNSGQE